MGDRYQNHHAYWYLGKRANETAPSILDNRDGFYSRSGGDDWDLWVTLDEALDRARVPSGGRYYLLRKGKAKIRYRRRTPFWHRIVMPKDT